MPRRVACDDQGFATASSADIGDVTGQLSPRRRQVSSLFDLKCALTDCFQSSKQVLSILDLKPTSNPDFDKRYPKGMTQIYLARCIIFNVVPA